MSDIYLSNGIKLHDADTFKQDGERHRFSYGDAPEVANPVKGTPADPGGESATQATAVALSNGYKPVPTGETDLRGRPLVNMVPPQSGPSLQSDLIASGAAYPSHWAKVDDKGLSMQALTRNGADTLAGGESYSQLADNEDFQFLANKAREERIASLQQRIASGELGRSTISMGALEDARESEDHSITGAGFARGVDGMQSTFYGFADALGSATGADALAQWGREGVARNVVEAMRNPATVESWEDIDGLADAMIYGLEAVSEFAPQLLTDLGLGVATGGGAVLSKQLLAGAAKQMLRTAGGSMAAAAPRQIAARGWEHSLFGMGAKAGAFTSAYMQNTGETQNQFRAEGIDAPGEALALGVSKAALDYAGLDATLRQAFKGMSREAITPERFADVLGRAVGASSIAFTAESLTEATQTLMDELAIQDHKPGYEINWSGVVDAALKGGIGGATVAGGTNLAVGSAQYLGQKEAEQARGAEENQIPAPQDQPAPVAADQTASVAPEAAPTEPPVAEQMIESAPQPAPLPEAVAQPEPAAEPAAEQQPVIPAPDAAPVVEQQPASEAAAVEQAAPTMTRAEREARAREALAAAAQPLPRAEPAPAVQAQAEADAREPVAPIDSVALVEQARQAGIDTTQFIEERTVADTKATRRVLMRKLAEVLPDTGRRVKDELDGRRIEDLSDEEVGGYLDRLGVADRPAQFAAIQDDQGQTTPEVENRYRQTVATAIAERIDRSFAQEKGFNLAPLADFLGVPAQELQRSFYTSGGKGNTQDNAFRMGVRRAIARRFGGVQQMRDALAELPPAELHSLASQLNVPAEVEGVKVVPQTERSLNVHGLKAAVEGRAPTRDKNWAADAPATPERESAPDAVAGKVGEVVNVARNMADVLFERDDTGSVRPRDVGYALNKLDGEARSSVVRRVNKLAGEPYSPQRLAFVSAVRESMLAEKGRAERRLAGEIEQDDQGDVLGVNPVLAEDAPQPLEPGEQRFLAELAAAPMLTNRRWDDRSSTAEDIEAAMNATRFMMALQRVVSPEDIGLGDKSLDEVGQARVNRALLLVTAIKGVLGDGASVSRFQADLQAITGLSDADVQVGSNRSATAAEALTGMAERVVYRQAQDLVRRMKATMAEDPAMELLVGELVGTDTPFAEALDAYLIDRANEDPRGFLRVLDDSIARMTGGSMRGIEQLTAPEPEVLEDEWQPGEDDALSEALGTYGEGQLDEAALDKTYSRMAQGKGARHGATQTGNEDEASDRSFWSMLYRSREKGGFKSGSPSIVTTEALQGRNLHTVQYMLHGFERAHRFDMVAMAMYAQGGERVPGTPVEAYNNLLANLTRAIAGPATLAVDHPMLFDPVSAIPPGDVVIFVDPATGKGVTFAEAEAAALAARRKQSTASEARKERDRLSANVAVLDLILDDLRGQLAERKAAATAPNEAAALERWVLALSPEGRLAIKDAPKLAAPVQALYDRYGREVRAGLTAIKRHAAALGHDGYKPKGITLRELASEFYASLGKISRLNDQLAEVGEFGGPEVGSFEEAMQQIAEERGDQFDTRGTERAATSLMRGKEGVIEADTSEEKPLAYDPLNPTRAALEYVALDAESRAALEAKEKWAALSRQLNQAPSQEFLDGLERSKAPAPKKKEPVQPRPATEPLKKLASELAATPRQATLQAERTEQTQRDGDTPVRMLGDKPVEARAFIGDLKSAGVPLPALTVFTRPESLEALAAQVPEADQAALQRGWDQGGSFYLRTSNGALVVLRPVDKARASMLLDLAHELGHAVKDQVWQSLSTERRDELLSAFERDTGLSAQREDDSALHEWFADQFAQAALKRASRQPVAKGSVAEAIRDLAVHIRRIWTALTGRLRGVAPEFADFAAGLFRGDFSAAQGGPSTQHAVPRFAAGADMLPKARSLVGRGVAQAKQYWAKGTLPDIGRRVLFMVVSRIKAHSPELASALFQQAGNESTGTRAWDQRQNAIRSRLLAASGPVIEAIRAGVNGKAAKAQAVKEAFSDAMSGSPITENGKKVRAMMDGLAAQAREDGLRSVQFEAGFPIAVFDREQVDKRRADFEAMLAERLGAAADVPAIVSRILEGVGHVEGAIAPGLPVGAHATTRAILDKISFAELNAAGWLLQEPEAALHHWIDGTAKRAAWEAVFGGFVDGGNHEVVAQRVFGESDPSGERLRAAGLMDEEGKLFDPNAKYKALIEQVRSQHGQVAAADVQDLVDGALGRHGQNMPGGVRRAYDAITGWVGLTVLAFSGIASIPELAMPLVRGGGKVNLRDVFADLPQARRFARDMGIVLSDTADRVAWQSMGEQYQSPLMQKVTHQFFKWNGNKLIVDLSRTMAVSVAMRYLQSALEAGDIAALTRLNVDAGSVRAWIDMGRPTWSPELPEAQRAVAKAVGDAINQFVGEATLRPSRFQATNWGNNPWLKVIWQLKHFLYTYGDTVLGGIWRETHRRYERMQGVDPAQLAVVATPALLFGVFVLPLAAAAMETRDWMRRLNGTQVREPNYDSDLQAAAAYVYQAFGRAGGFGPLEVLGGMGMAAEYGRSPLLALSPTLSKLEYLADWGKDGALSEAELVEKVRSLTPIWSQNKTLFGLLE